ncbi:uncharacterized protein LOC112558098 [Pomacea canaliculata]|uniref:uncharacterized protein LOC112558098 n=1 Tax=Pomacea canaliculata TaxID=400727 RepID=UPI000D7395FE|nr:uncharacterized protein LOC112558098 [Pomacea canaliculata]
MLMDRAVKFWKSLKTVLCVLWNCSDISPKLCKSISDCGVLVTLLHLLAQVIKTSDFVLDEKKHFLVKAFLGILHNAVRNCADCKGILLETGTMHILPQLFTAASPMVKAKSLMVASYLVNEKENEVLNSSDDTISFIVQVLADSTKSKNHTSSKYGMNCLEIMKGLNNIAMNDANKVKIVSAGGLKLFAMLLVSENQEEQELSALSVWTLAFASPVKGRIIQEPGLVEGLKNLIKGKHTSGGHYARGALWELFHGHDIVEKTALDTNIPHIMISYQWDAQGIMSKVKDMLMQAGYKVWMDVEHMTGSTLEAMALAVERAAVVLVCMSEKYKSSANCRTESEYVFRLRKDIIPLRVQSGYRPDGWLGMLVGTRLYFDFSSEKHMQSNLSKLLRELANRGKIHPVASEVKEIDAINEKIQTSEKSLTSSDPTGKKEAQQVGAKQLPMVTRDLITERWGQQEVAKWLTDNKLGQFVDRFATIDGPLLLEMRRVRKAAPEFFYRTLQQDLHMDLSAALRFSQCLGKLV